MVATSKIVVTNNNNKQSNICALALNNKQLETSSCSPKMVKVSGTEKASTDTPNVALTARGKPKEKRRNNEKRKERSRDAARCRRSRETEIFSELAEVLPLKKEEVQQLDKASIMRMAIAYLRVRDMLKMFPKIQELLGNLQLSDNIESLENSDTALEVADTSALNSTTDSNDTTITSLQTSDDSAQQTIIEKSLQSCNGTNNMKQDLEDNSLMLKQTMDGFLLILSDDGDITYVTANISDYLGLSKIDILGQQIWEYAHQCDHAELKEALNIKRNGLVEKIKDQSMSEEEGISTHHRDLFLRLKCTITSRGRSINIKSASYKVIHVTGHLVVNTKGDRVLVAVGRPIPHPSNIEVPLGTSTFLTKHSLDMKFTYADDKMFNLLGYKPADLLDTSLFDYHHGIDSESLMTTFKNVFSKGQGETCRYRFLGKYGGFCWIVTQATIVYEKLKPQSVVCVNFVISNLEQKHEIYTLQQYEQTQKLKIEENRNLNETTNNDTKTLNEIKSKVEDIINEQPKEEKLFAANVLEQSIEAVETKVNILAPPKNHPFNNNQINKNNNVINNQINDNNNIKNNQATADIINVKTIIKEEQILPSEPVNKNNKTNQTTGPLTEGNTAIAISSIPVAVNATTPSLIGSLPLSTHCPTTTVTHTVFNKSKTTPNFSLSADDKRPKTVTSSLILTNLPTTTSTQSILQHQHQQHSTLNVATRAAQSVTASVLTPLPIPPPKLPSTTATAAILAQQQQQTVAVLSTSGTSTKIINSASAVSNDSFFSKNELSPTPELLQASQPKGGKETISENHQQDMNKGYLLFAEDATELTMLKEEPDDLTAHLVATNAVDACIPLDESGPLFGEILVGFGMGSYGSLLPDDINSLESNTSSSEHSTNNNGNNQASLKLSSNTIICSSSASSSSSSSTTSYNTSASAHSHGQSSPSLITTATTCATNTSNTTATKTPTNITNIDPFINYREESNDTNCSQHLLSPSVTSKSPEGSSLPSLCSPNSLSQEEEFSYYTMNVDDMDDLSMRAPYIPMNEQDDLPLLTSDDYMWSSGNAFTPDEFSLSTKDADNLQAMQINQSLNYQQQQFTQQQTQPFSNSLCSSPASTVSSMSPSPIQQQQNSQQIFSADSSELAALLCGAANGSLAILQDASNFTNSLNLNGDVAGDSGGNQNSNSNNNNGTGENSVGLTDDLDNVNGVSSSATSATLNHHHQLQQHCLQQFQEELQQQQQQQQLLSGLNINCKKEKFEAANNSPSLTSNLCDSIEDTFDNVYNKNSTNLDCWNEFLQINTNESSNTANNKTDVNMTTITAPQQGMEKLRQEDCKQQLHVQLQQQQQTQNIIINAVPLITIQATSNNKNVLMPTLSNQQQHQQQQHQQQQQNSSNTKPLNKVNTIKLTPISTTAAIKVIGNEQQLQLLHQQQQQQQQNIKTAFIQATPTSAVLQSNNKRHLSNNQIASNTLESKRLKSNVVDMQNSTTTSQLLQQLITTPQQQQQQANLNKNNSKGILESIRRPYSNENQSLTQQQQQQQPKQQQTQKQSNSVLKNLLISGCDTNNLPESLIIAIDDDAKTSMQSPDLCLSPSLTKPLNGVSSSAALLRNYRHNPLIGGPGVLPSPTASLITNEDSNPPGLMPCDVMDSASDGGNDDISTAENMSPLKRPYEQQKKQIENVYGLMTPATIIANSNVTVNANVNKNISNNLNNDKKRYNNKTILQINNHKDLENINANGLKTLPLTATPTTSATVLMQEAEMAKKLNEDNDEEDALMIKRKRSISYVDSSNPLLTPFLMDLCSDDYHMNTKEYLQENIDIENVLSEWPVDLV